MKYNFKAKDDKGSVREGVIEAISEQNALAILQKNKLVPIDLEQVKQASQLVKDLKKMWEGASAKEMAAFFRQLAILIEAKVPIVQSLRAIEEQTENSYLRLVIREIAADIQEGMPFSESLEKHPDVFHSLTANIVRSGEISGNLQNSVSFIADSIEKNNELNSKIKSALYYPLFVVTVASIVGFIVVTVILPKLTVIIKDLNVPIPWYTKLVMSVGDFMANFWWAVLIAIFALIGSFFYYIKTEAGRREWDHFKIKIPVFGRLMRSIYLARFSDNLALMVHAGIPIVRALTIVSDIVGNSVYQGIILRSADEVRSGGQISTVLARSADFPPIVAQMTRIGEETGKLGEVLKSVTKFYEQEVDRTSRNMTALIEPILIVILAIGVAIMVFAILLPIYNIAGSL